MINVENKSKQLEERTLDFTVNVIKFCRTLSNSSENTILKNQLIRAASSIGANYTEANNASSRVDFRNKIFIAKKEAAETRYWLRAISRTNDGVEVDGLIDEVSQLLLILQKIVSTLKNGK